MLDVTDEFPDGSSQLAVQEKVSPLGMPVNVELKYPIPPPSAQAMFESV